MRLSRYDRTTVAEGGVASQPTGLPVRIYPSLGALDQAIAQSARYDRTKYRHHQPACSDTGQVAPIQRWSGTRMALERRISCREP